MPEETAVPARAEDMSALLAPTRYWFAALRTPDWDIGLFPQL